MAASVPRFMRTARLAYLPLQTVIGSYIVRGDGGVNLIFDVIMLPELEFKRMRSHVGLQNIVAPNLRPGNASFAPTFVPSDQKQVEVPADILDPRAYAHAHFVRAFGLDRPEGAESLLLNYFKTLGEIVGRGKTVC
jgi:hypothetical protein